MAASDSDNSSVLSWIIFLGLGALGFVFLLVFVPITNPRVDPPGSPVYEVGLETLGLGQSGEIHLEDVPTKKGVRYSIYLVDEHMNCSGMTGGCYRSTNREEGQGIEILDSGGYRIENELERFEWYGVSTEASFSMAEFTAPTDGRQALELILGEVVFVAVDRWVDKFDTYRVRDTPMGLSYFLELSREELKQLKLVIRKELAEVSSDDLAQESSSSGPGLGAD